MDDLLSNERIFKDLCACHPDGRDQLALLRRSRHPHKNPAPRRHGATGQTAETTRARHPPQPRPRDRTLALCTIFRRAAAAKCAIAAPPPESAVPAGGINPNATLPMNDKTANHLNMARRCVACLEKPANSAVWAAVPPLIFGTKVTALKSLIAAAENFARSQTRITIGSAEDKDREETELEDICFTMSGLLVSCCTDGNDLTGAAPFDISLTKWRRMRDETLLLRARDLAAALQTRIDADAVTAEQYDINPAAVAALNKEINDYAAFITAPDNAIGERKTVGIDLKEKVKEILTMLETLDRLIVSYRKRPGGPALISEWQQARIIIDRGHGPSSGPSPASPTP